ncbi:MAG TPA: hypothetical protein ENN29_04975 [Candidatus Hydrogenedentes bacterium]|nr:hypothetical protein [Candidatus Hydrogenedentota bacterium]
MALDKRAMRDIYERTIILRTPTYGIIKGYHELPYICLGEALESASGSMRVRGRIHVSPQFIIKPKQYNSSYSDIFGEDEVDLAIAGRMFGFLGFPNHPVECSSEQLELSHEPDTIDALIGKCMDAFERSEDITTGLILTPESKYYQISIERFIAEIIEDEFR